MQSLSNPCSYSPHPVLQSLREYVRSSQISPYLTHSSTPVFIAEITARAFIIADASKRRTLSRADISNALNKSDQFDFLIDIVPRDELIYPVPASATLGTGLPAKRAAKSNTSETQAQSSVRTFYPCCLAICPSNFNCRRYPLTLVSKLAPMNRTPNRSAPECSSVLLLIVFFS